jgi:hypothetical protein
LSSSSSTADLVYSPVQNDVLNDKPWSCVQSQEEIVGLESVMSELERTVTAESTNAAAFGRLPALADQNTIPPRRRVRHEPPEQEGRGQGPRQLRNDEERNV